MEQFSVDHARAAGEPSDGGTGGGAAVRTMREV
jgi:hypothetical protein